MRELQDRKRDFVVQHLTRKQQEALSVVDTEETQYIAKYGAADRANKAGWQEHFGETSGADRRMALQRGIQRDLEVKLKDEREIIVKMESDHNEVIRVAMNEIRPLLDRNNKQVIDGIRQETSAAVGELNKKLDEHLYSHRLG